MQENVYSLLQNDEQSQDETEPEPEPELEPDPEPEPEPEPVLSPEQIKLEVWILSKYAENNAFPNKYILS